jgi:UPF0716 family protein affecting phage T7 exclusion
MLAEIKSFVKAHKGEAILFIMVFLLIMLSFSFGFIIAKNQDKALIEITNYSK